MIGVSYSVSDGMNNLEATGVVDVSTEWPARVVPIYGSHKASIDDWMLKKNARIHWEKRMIQKDDTNVSYKVTWGQELTAAQPDCDHSKYLVNDYVSMANWQEEDANHFDLCGCEPRREHGHDFVLVLGLRIVKIQVNDIRPVAKVIAHSAKCEPDNSPSEVGTHFLRARDQIRSEAVSVRVRCHELVRVEGPLCKHLGWAELKLRQQEIALCCSIDTYSPYVSGFHERVQASLVQNGTGS